MIKNSKDITSSIIRCRAYARAGLIGNPSDGFFGKTISFTLKEFYAEVVLYPSRHLELLPGPRDLCIYSDIDAAVQSINDYGYYGGIRLLQASLRRFRDYCQSSNHALRSDNFSMRYFTNIPSHVGMAGSSAIITACFRALMRFYGVEIPKEQLPNIILSVETEELGIDAGLQDRVAQVYQGLTYMDFNRELMNAQGFGHYEALDPEVLKHSYIAYKKELSEGSEVYHSNLRSRFDLGEPKVVDAIRQWADLAEEARAYLLAGDAQSVGPLLDANFDLRRSLSPIHSENIAMVEGARSVGASAKFTGSGGAIVGLYQDESMYTKLVECLKDQNIVVFKPEIV